MSDLIGRTLGPYQVVREIGHGGMADVYLAVQPAVKRQVAIKVLPSLFLQDRTFLERFNREVEIIARLQHPRILPVIDFGEQDGMPYIVMAYLPGGTLADRIAGSAGGLALDEAARLVEQIAEGLDYAHEKGVVHRDFKPSNVLLDEKGNVHLADFGIARVAADTAQLTGTGLIGTPAYMAPEMSQPGAVTPQIDVYALGVTLFQMLTGALPYSAETPMGVLLAHANQPIPNILKARPDLPAGVQTVIEGAMAKTPAARYGSAGELARALRAAAGGASVTPVAVGRATDAAPTGGLTTPLAPTAAPARRSLPGWAWAAGALAVVAVVVGVWGLVVRPAPAAAPTASATPTFAVTPTSASPTATSTPAATAAVLPVGVKGRIAFASNLDSNWDIYTVNAEDGTLTRLTNNPAIDDYPAWAPDGSKIAFISFRGGAAGVYLMNADGSGATQIVRWPGSDYPVWSPDGKKIAFRSGSNDRPGLYLINPDGSSLTNLTPYWLVDEPLSWSSDGSKIAFSSDHDGFKDIYVIGAGGGQPTQITKQAQNNTRPAWSPDGRRIAFVSTRDGHEEIYVMNADGSAQTRLTNTSGSSYPDSPVWSPDGTMIVMRFTGGEIAVMKADGSNLTEVIEACGCGGGPRWSPDGNWLAFVDIYNGNANLFLFNAAGGAPARLTNITGNTTTYISILAWQP